MKYKVFSVDENGERTEISAQSIIIELDDDKCVELDVNPHPNHRNSLPISIPFNLGISDSENSHSIFNIKPGACNVIYLHIEKIKAMQ